MTQVAIDPRFEGLPGVSHGGYIAGLAAKALGASASVTLTRAVPAGSMVVIRDADTGCILEVDGEVAATATVDEFPSSAPVSISADDAERASQGYLGLSRHFFPRCITCGPEVPEGEGLRIFPGPVHERRLVASLWHPPAMVRQADGSVASEFLWTALDCPAIWGIMMHGENEPNERAVTGRLAVRQLAPVAADRPNIVLGWPIERQGRKLIGGAAIYSESGDLLVEARETMILTDRGVPLHPSAWTRASGTAV